MTSAKALVDTNLKLSEARNVLFELKKEEEKYIEIREKKAVKAIEKIVEESGEMVKEAQENYSRIKELFIEVNQFSGDLIKIHTELQEMVSVISERNVEWQKYVDRQKEEVEETRKQIKVEKQIIENDKKTILKDKKTLVDERRKLNDEKETVQRTIERLKHNRI